MAHRVLYTATIMRTAALALALVAGSASVASAGGFVGLGIGTSPATSGSVDLEENGRSGRIELGYRFGRFAVEGILGGAHLAGQGRFYAGQEPQWTTLGVAGKLNIPLQDKFEVYGRLGYQQTYLSGSGAPNTTNDLSGGGLMASLGAELRLDIGVAGGSVFIDYTLARASLSSFGEGMDSYDMTSRVWTIGATLGF